MAPVDLLEPVIQPYAWGSTLAIAQLQGRPTPSAGPEAELWFGAHPSAPSGVRRDEQHTTLDAVIAADPARELGPGYTDRFGPRLPFLLKILAAEQALSIQVHPDGAQARAGFRAENERGVALADPARNYVDDWPKPEVLCALTRFEALAGFRSPGEAADLLDALAVPALTSLVDQLRKSDDPNTMRDVLDAVLNWPRDTRADLLRDAIAACTRAAGADPAFAAAARTATHHPDDLGALASLLLRHLVLAPGEALFMPAGGIHAYLHGVGVELLANSDNVLRAGLTRKHIDRQELLRIVDPAVRVPLLRAEPAGPGVTVYPVEVPEFQLFRLDLTGEPVTLPGTGPRLVLCVDGEAALHTAAGAPVKLTRAAGCFVPASDGPVSATGQAALFAACVGTAASAIAAS
jgi:mannose-6-phosphate isomerase